MADRQKKYKLISLIFFTFFFISLVVFIYSLRANYREMTKLRSALYTADKNGNDVNSALGNLRNYVISHMNTELSSSNSAVYPPIQLQYTYQRLLDSQLSSQQQNSSLYTDAENYCQATVPNGFSGRYRIPCVENYINTHSTTKVSVDPALYQFDFISPSWSPDLAGYSEIASIIFGIFALYAAVLFLVTRRKV